MPRGGARPNSGPKPNPAKQLRIGQAAAQKLWREIGYAKEVKRLYEQCNDTRLKLQILFRIDEKAFPKLPDDSDKNQPLAINVNIRRIGA